MGRFKHLGMALSAVALLSACGDGGSSSGGTPSPPIAGPTPTPAPTPSPPPTGSCSLRERQDWAAAQLNEWYLSPDLLAANVNPDSYTTVPAYIDALVAPARAQNKDRFFTRLLSIAQDNNFANAGASAGFGFRLSTDAAAGRMFVIESFEGAPALNAGIDRGAEIVAIGTAAADLRTVGAIIAAEGTAGLTTALEPATILLRVRELNATVREVIVTKANYVLDPVSNRYGALILDDGGKKVGYLNFRVFQGAPAQADLRAAFTLFRAQGITQVIVDLRYNTGGLNATTELLANLLLGNRSASDAIFSINYRPSKASLNRTGFFAPQPQSISAIKIAFIGTGSTVSASELIMNTVLPYLGANAALIGSNTQGKPVGSNGIDRAACDDRLSLVMYAYQNRNGETEYFNGMASRFQSTCRATDDILRPLGDPQEEMIRTALDFLAGRQCTPISAGISALSVSEASSHKLLTPERPDTARREMPDTF